MYGDTTESIHNYLIRRRDGLVNDEVVVQNNDGHYECVKDHEFSSPSQAVAVVFGRSPNEWIE